MALPGEYVGATRESRRCRVGDHCTTQARCSRPKATWVATREDQGGPNTPAGRVLQASSPRPLRHGWLCKRNPVGHKHWQRNGEGSGLPTIVWASPPPGPILETNRPGSDAGKRTSLAHSTALPPFTGPRGTGVTPRPNKGPSELLSASGWRGEGWGTADEADPRGPPPPEADWASGPGALEETSRVALSGAGGSS